MFDVSSGIIGDRKDNKLVGGCVCGGGGEHFRKGNCLVVLIQASVSGKIILIPVAEWCPRCLQ